MAHEFCHQYLREALAKLPAGVEPADFEIRRGTLGFIISGPRTFEWYGEGCCKADALVRAIDEYLDHYGYKNRKIPKAIMRTIEQQLLKKRKAAPKRG